MNFLSLLARLEPRKRPLPTVTNTKKNLAFEAPVHMNILGGIRLICVIDYVAKK